ncbi:uncharacterized protein LOC128198599 [Bicyclus anynana]|uniref:Uncharacterized protein LOC128198599 n=1 Tax=Bicyclus anynana TaxID=110368 RepID=A0ABM3LNY5_BICAN|nr:uncharacterized protein LOC128198599 [Bicyclus anynana]
MDEIKCLLKAIQTDISETKDRVKNSEENLLRKIDEKFDDVQLKLQALEHTIQSQENRLDFLEKQIRTRNILIFGVEETERSYDELLKIILHILNYNMNVNCSALEIEYMRRKGKKIDKIRPIVISFTTLGRKIEILRNKKSLINSNYYIKEDYPPKVLAIRKELQEKANEERDKGKRVYIKYDKLIILPQKVSQEPLQSRYKRNISVTPPSNQKKHQEKNLTHLHKKHTLQSYWTPKQTLNSSSNETFLSPKPTTSFHTATDQNE